MSNYNKIAIKVGSNVLTNSDGSLNINQISSLVHQICLLKKEGIQVILISSGAVAAGRSDIELSKKTGIVGAKQVWAALGQAKLISTYTTLFQKCNYNCAQVLTTKESFSDRRHYLNMQSCIAAMLDNDIVPIVNENDTIAVTELMFTDNDELSGLIASMMGCQALFILSNIDGIFTGDPKNEDSQLIPLIDEKSKNISDYIAPTKSGFGRGGMITKYSIAKKIAKQGIEVFIANGMRNDIMLGIIHHLDVPCTQFKASTRKSKSVKKWLAHSETFAKGSVIVNQGAQDALFSDKANSLLFVGILDVIGYFEEGDIVMVVSEKQDHIAVGKAQFNSEEVKKRQGQKHNKPFIHYDYLNMVD